MAVARKTTTKTKSTAKKTTITKKIIDQAEMLAGKAYNISRIADALQVSYSVCTQNEKIKQAIKQGQSKARQTVVDHLMSRSEADQSSTATIFLAKQLKVFTVPYQTSTPKTIQEASDRIKQLYADTASGVIDEERANYLIGFLESYIKSKEVGDLENRIKALEAKDK